MEGKEWFNLRQICRHRFNNTHDESKFSLSCCKRGVAMCCRRAGVVGVVGAVLVFLGLVQLVAGLLFLLVLPMFQMGSNIWTGAWCGICGAILGAIGWKQQTLRKGQVILVASLSVLVAEVANLVIIQVEDRRIIVDDGQNLTKQIAFWLTTMVTALGIVVSFFGAQYLFCVVVRGPRVKGRMPVTRSLSEEDLHHRQVQITRFQPPSLTTDTRVESLDMAVRSSGNGSGHVHGFSDGGGVSSSQNRPRVVITNVGGFGDGSIHQEEEAPGSSGTGEATEQAQGSSKKQAPKTPEDSVPYFLRNHRSAWQFILPEVVSEMRMSNRFSVTESITDVQSRTSTLSKASKSSFHPYRPNLVENDRRPDVIDVSLLPSGQNGDVPVSSVGAPSSCNTSLYSIPESCRKSGSKSPSGYKVVRPNVPPPAPPATKNSTALRNASTGGWESCAVLQYPAQAGGGFVVDLD